MIFKIYVSCLLHSLSLIALFQINCYFFKYKLKSKKVANFLHFLKFE